MGTSGLAYKVDVSNKNGKILSPFTYNMLGILLQLTISRCGVFIFNLFHNIADILAGFTKDFFEVNYSESVQRLICRIQITS